MPYAVRDKERGLIIDTVFEHEACAAIHYMVYTTGCYCIDDFSTSGYLDWRYEFNDMSQMEGAEIVVVGILEVHKNERIEADQGETARGEGGDAKAEAEV